MSIQYFKFIATSKGRRFSKPGFPGNPSVMISIFLSLVFQIHFHVLSQTADGHSNVDNIKVFPSWVPLVNVKDFGAKGDGKADDTRAIQAAIQSGKISRQVYFPAGVYLVSKPLVSLNSDSIGQSWLQLYGAGKNFTTILLKNRADSFQNKENPTALVQFRAGRERINGLMSERPNLAFFNSIYDMTIDIGVANPGAVGIDWVVCNAGTLRHVNVVSSDPQLRGAIGVRMKHSDGTGYISDLTIKGFDYGWWRADNAQSMAAEGLKLLRQRVSGIYNVNSVLAVNNLVSDNKVPTLIQVDGIAQASILNATITGSPEKVFVQKHADAMLYLRNINAAGAKILVQDVARQNKTSVLAGEWFSHTAASQGKMASLNLPIKQSPEYHNNDTSTWAMVSNFSDDGTDDYSVRLQKAMDSGAETIVMDGSGSRKYKSPVIVRRHVRRIIGFWQSSAASKDASFKINIRSLLSIDNEELNQIDSTIDKSQWFMQIEGDSDTPLIIERFHHFPGGILNNASRPLVLRDMNLPAYMNTPVATKDLFAEDIQHGSNYKIRHGQHAWLRNVDAVFGTGPDILVDSATAWIFSNRTEGGGVFVKVVNGGSVEIINTSQFVGSNGVGTNLAYDIVEGNFSIVNFSELGFMRHGIYQKLVADRNRNLEITRSSPGVFKRYKMNKIMLYRSQR